MSYAQAGRLRKEMYLTEVPEQVSSAVAPSTPSGVDRLQAGYKLVPGLSGVVQHEDMRYIQTVSFQNVDKPDCFLMWLEPDGYGEHDERWAIAESCSDFTRSQAGETDDETAERVVAERRDRSWFPSQPLAVDDARSIPPLLADAALVSFESASEGKHGWYILHNYDQDAPDAGESYPLVLEQMGDWPVQTVAQTVVERRNCYPGHNSQQKRGACRVCRNADTICEAGAAHQCPNQDDEFVIFQEYRYQHHPAVTQWRDLDADKRRAQAVEICRKECLAIRGGMCTHFLLSRRGWD